MRNTLVYILLLSIFTPLAVNAKYGPEQDISEYYRKNAWEYLYPQYYLMMFKNSEKNLKKEIDEFKDNIDYFDLGATNHEEKDMEENRKMYLTTGKVSDYKEDEDFETKIMDAYKYIKQMPAAMIKFLYKYYDHRNETYILNILELKKEMPPHEMEARFTGSHDPSATEKLLAVMEKAVRKLDDMIADGDILVVPGNTGQYLARALQAFTSKKINVVAMAISGQPGVRATAEGSRWEWVRNMLTSTGLKNYQKYAENLLAEPVNNLKEGQKIYFLDVVGAGVGINFLIETIEYISGKRDLDINLIQIGSARYVDFKNNRFNLHRHTIDHTGLPMLNYFYTDKITPSGFFDDIKYEYRLLPDFPAYLWDDWKANDPSMFKPTEKAEKFIEEIEKYFKNIRT